MAAFKSTEMLKLGRAGTKLVENFVRLNAASLSEQTPQAWKTTLKIFTDAFFEYVQVSNLKTMKNAFSILETTLHTAETNRSKKKSADPAVRELFNLWMSSNKLACACDSIEQFEYRVLENLLHSSKWELKLASLNLSGRDTVNLSKTIQTYKRAALAFVSARAFLTGPPPRPSWTELAEPQAGAHALGQMRGLLGAL